jgi:hypothetical protein
MAPVTLSESSIGVFIHGVTALLSILKKAAEHKDAETFASSKLFDDMLPLTFQVQMVSNTAKKSVWRLTADPALEVSWPDDEKTLEELIARTEKTLDMLKTADNALVDTKNDSSVDLAMGKRGNFKISGKEYVLSYALPNFFFHLVTAYGILRSKGVELGKSDYLGSFMAGTSMVPAPAA